MTTPSTPTSPTPDDAPEPPAARRRPGPRTVAIGALALLLAAAPFVPRGADEEGGLVPSGDPVVAATTAGESAVTPEMRAEIEAVVAEGRAAAPHARMLPGDLARSLVRCALLEGQRYCLGAGWTTDSEGEVQARMATAARVAARTTGAAARDRGAVPETTGDLDALGLLRRQASLTPAQRARQERRELLEAARSVAKVWLLRHHIEGVQLPDGFLQRHPEARATTGGAGTTGRTTGTAVRLTSATTGGTATTTSAASASASTVPATAPATATASTTATPASTTAYPAEAAILNEAQVAEQNRTYWCGPAALQMIQWGFWQRKPTQRRMAAFLGTTTSGSAISDMVRVINRRSGWDNPEYAGRYVALDIKRFTFGQWWDLIQRHVATYRAPVVLHPVLIKRFYPYLDDDASGHFQVGRGYKNQPNGLKLLGYFEPWNQQRFNRAEPYIERVQWRRAYRSYRANQAHFQHNIGV